MRVLRFLALAALVLGVTLLLILAPLALHFAPGRLDRFRRRLFLRASRATLRILGVRVTVSGPLPEPPFLLVTNHLGYLDVLVVASLVESLFLAKAEVRSWPLLGWVTAQFGTLYLDRTDRRALPRALEAVERALAAGRGVTIFPEGTSSSGAAVEAFRSPMLALPSRAGLAVHAAAVSYRTAPGDPPAHLAVCWWGDMDFAPHLLGLLRLRRVEASLSFCPEPIREENRKLLAERLRAAVAGCFEPVVQAEETALWPARVPGVYGASE